jgi:hypothetical protein
MHLSFCGSIRAYFCADRSQDTEKPMNWFAKKLLGGRFAMNRRIVEMLLGKRSPLDRAKAVVAGLETVQRLQFEEPEVGSFLGPVFTEGTQVSPDVAVKIYEKIEDNLNLRLRIQGQALSQAPVEIKDMLRDEFEELVLGTRLLMVQIARIADYDFKQSTRNIGKLLLEVRPELPNAIALRSRKKKLTNKFSPTSWTPDYEDLEVSTDMFLMHAGVTW